MTYVICGIPGVNGFEGKNRELILSSFINQHLTDIFWQTVAKAVVGCDLKMGVGL